MDGGTRLKPGSGKRLLVLFLGVLLVHALVLQWLAGLLELRSTLKPLATPMFTRLLQPEQPVVPTPAPAAVAAPRARRPAVSSITTARAPKPSRAASAATSDTAKPAEDSVAAAAAAASAPADAASAAAGDSSAPVAAASQPAASDANDASAAQAAASAAVAAASAPALPSPAIVIGPDTWPADTRVSYRLGGYYRGELHGSAKVQWLRQGDRYETRIDIDIALLVSLALVSQGEVTVQGLFPRVYEELRRGGPRTARMDDETVTLSDGRTTVPRPPGVQDTASQFVELSHRFSTGQEAMEVGRSVDIWMARPGGVDLWTYDIVDRTRLVTPNLGEVEAFHLKPRMIAKPRGNITAEIWFAPSLQYLPVRILVSMGDTYVDLMVDKIEQR